MRIMNWKEVKSDIMLEFREALSQYLEIGEALGHQPTKQELVDIGRPDLAGEISTTCGFRYLRDVASRKRSRERNDTLLKILAEYTGEDLGSDGGVMPRRYFEAVRSEGDADGLAKRLLGKYLVREFPSGDERRMLLTELGVHYGIAGSTHKKEHMGNTAGTIWINSRYGHRILNIATGDEEHPGCIVVRGGWLETASGFKDLSGPGAVTRSLQIGNNLTGTVLGETISIEGNQEEGEIEIITPKRAPENLLGYYRLNLYTE